MAPYESQISELEAKDKEHSFEWADSAAGKEFEKKRRTETKGNRKRLIERTRDQALPRAA